MSFFPNLFSCIRLQSSDNHTLPNRSHSFEFFHTFEVDNKTGEIKTYCVDGNQNTDIPSEFSQLSAEMESFCSIKTSRSSKNNDRKINNSNNNRQMLNSCLSGGSKDKSSSGRKDKRNKSHQESTKNIKIEEQINSTSNSSNVQDSPKSVSSTDSDTRQLLDSSSSDDSAKTITVTPRSDLNITHEDIEIIKERTLSLVQSCIELKNVIEKTSLNEYVTSVKNSGEALKSLLIKIAEKTESMPDSALNEIKKMQMGQTLLQTQMKHLVQTMRQAQENANLTIADYYKNTFLQSCIHLAVYAKHFLQAFLSIATVSC